MRFIPLPAGFTASYRIVLGSTALVNWFRAPRSDPGTFEEGAQV